VQRWKRPVQQPLIAAGSAGRAVVEHPANARLGAAGSPALGEIGRAPVA
jgi:hypothetical protein